MAAKEITLKHGERWPKEYCFVKKGNPYISRHAKAETLALNMPVFIVLDASGTRTGLAVPISIARKIREQERNTRIERKAAVAAKDKRELAQAHKCLMKMFPAIPADSAQHVLSRAFKKSSGRVGRTGKLSLGDRVRLAVRAHARHEFSAYDTLLGEKLIDKANARKMVIKTVEAVEAKWKESPVDALVEKTEVDTRSSKWRPTRERNKKLGRTSAPKGMLRRLYEKRGPAKTKPKAKSG